jgi:hypothetical protein
VSSQAIEFAEVGTVWKGRGVLCTSTDLDSRQGKVLGISSHLLGPAPAERLSSPLNPSRLRILLAYDGMAWHEIVPAGWSCSIPLRWAIGWIARNGIWTDGGPARQKRWPIQETPAKHAPTLDLDSGYLRASRGGKAGQKPSDHGMIWSQAGVAGAFSVTRRTANNIFPSFWSLPKGKGCDTCDTCNRLLPRRYTGTRSRCRPSISGFESGATILAA